MVEVKEKSGSSRLIQMRSRIDIIASILNEAVKGAKKTRIMYRCNLSYKQLQSYLKLLLDMELLSLVSEKGDSKTDCFKTSAKGFSFLNTYRRLKTLVA